VGGNSNTLLIGASGQVKLLLDLTQLVFYDDGVVGTIEGRGPQLQETLKLPLEVDGRSTMAMAQAFSQGL